MLAALVLRYEVVSDGLVGLLGEMDYDVVMIMVMGVVVVEAGACIGRIL
jgi:hypothetical protein